MSIGLQEMVERRYDPLDGSLVFVNRPDDLDPMYDGDSLRAQMSCGHAVTPESLAMYCLNELDKGNYKFQCPALVEGTRRCNKLWSYKEVRRLADLSVEEIELFEETISRLAAAKYCEFKTCPKCQTRVERKDRSNLCVQCPICTADQGRIYYFCWQCRRDWKGPGPRSKRCDNDNCSNRDLQLLRTCKSITLPMVEGVTCPSVRACPTCGMRVEHSRENCKNIACPRCHVEFCFLCLKPKRVCCQNSSPYKICPSGVAPRQKSIPVWGRD